MLSISCKLRIIKEKVYSTSSKATYSYPVVVLINENSASASEILASAFKRNIWCRSSRS